MNAIEALKLLKEQRERLDKAEVALERVDALEKTRKAAIVAAVKAYDDGIEALSKETGLSVDELLGEYAELLPPKKAKAKQQRTTATYEGSKEQLEKLIAEGKTGAEIAKALGTGLATVNNWKRKLKKGDVK